jgi:outer membrane protein assembly factor BamB
VSSIYLGVPLLSGGTQNGSALVRLNAQNGNVCALGATSPSGSGIPISGAPVTTTGAPTTGTATSLTGQRDVVFYADNAGFVYALDASTLAPLINSANRAFPDQARPGISGVVPPPPAGTNTPFSPPIGASLIVANGHLYFGNSAGTIFNYSY